MFIKISYFTLHPTVLTECALIAQTNSFLLKTLILLYLDMAGGIKNKQMIAELFEAIILVLLKRLAFDIDLFFYKICSLSILWNFPV